MLYNMLLFQETKETITKSKGIVTTLTETLSEWWFAFVEKLPKIGVAILVIIVFYVLAGFSKKILLRILRKHMANRSVRRIIAKIVYATIILVGFFLTLGILNLDKALTSILAGAGVAALAIGLALQGTLSNTFSGVMLSFLPRIRIGDFIETSDHSGFVHEISLRNLVLRQPDNKFVIMPNSKFIEEPFVNYSLETRGRITVSCKIAYGSNLHAVKKMVLELIEANFPPQEGERIEFYYTEFGESSINFMTRFWIDYNKKSQMYTAQDEAILLINDLFKKHDVVIPFPIRTIMTPDLKNTSKE
jgi:small conductance mechanosensitive channel